MNTISLVFKNLVYSQIKTIKPYTGEEKIMKESIRQVTISCLIKEEDVLMTLMNAGVKANLKTEEIQNEENKSAVEVKGEKHAARLGSGKQGRVDTAGIVTFDAGGLKTPKKNIKNVSPVYLPKDLTDLGFMISNVFLVIKDGDIKGKGFLKIEYSLDKPAMDIHPRIGGQLQRITGLNYGLMSVFHNPPRPSSGDPENLTINFFQYYFKKGKNCRVATVGPDHEFVKWPTAADQAVSV